MYISGDPHEDMVKLTFKTVSKDGFIWFAHTWDENLEIVLELE